MHSPLLNPFCLPGLGGPGGLRDVTFCQAGIQGPRVCLAPHSGISDSARGGVAWGGVLSGSSPIQCPRCSWGPPTQ